MIWENKNKLTLSCKCRLSYRRAVKFPHTRTHTTYIAYMSTKAFFINSRTVRVNVLFFGWLALSSSWFSSTKFTAQLELIPFHQKCHQFISNSCPCQYLFNCVILFVFSDDFAFNLYILKI